MASERRTEDIREGGPDRFPRLRFILEFMDENDEVYSRAVAEGDRDDVLYDGQALLTILGEPSVSQMAQALLGGLGGTDPELD